MVHELPQLSQYYGSMAQALDTTRHELQTQGIHIPEAKDEQAEFEGMSPLDQYIDLFFVLYCIFIIPMDPNTKRSRCIGL